MTWISTDLTEMDLDWNWFEWNWLEFRPSFWFEINERTIPFGDGGGCDGFNVNPPVLIAAARRQTDPEESSAGLFYFDQQRALRVLERIHHSHIVLDADHQPDFKSIHSWSHPSLNLKLATLYQQDEVDVCLTCRSLAAASEPGLSWKSSLLGH